MRNKLTILLMLLMLAPAVALAEGNFITSVDVMKYTKDTLNNQFSNAQINSVVSLITKNVKPEYISISVPLDDTTGYAQRWVNSIHSHGAKVIFRGTWSGIEGIYDFPKLVGDQRFPPGTASSAATDGNSTWLGKTYQYILNNPNLFSENDIWAILPERTEGIFQDQTSFLSHEGNLQTNYANFFIDLNKVSQNAFAKIGKNVKVGYSANNFSEIASGWMPVSLYTSTPSISVDHYGITHTPAEMENDLRTASKRYGKPIFLQEWGDYWNSNLGSTDRTTYLKSMYEVFRKLAAEKILVGFNYWGGWVNNLEGILSNTNGTYSLNYRGEILADFFASFNPVVPSTPQQTVQPQPVLINPNPQPQSQPQSQPQASPQPMPVPTPGPHSVQPSTQAPSPTPIVLPVPQATLEAKAVVGEEPITLKDLPGPGIRKSIVWPVVASAGESVSVHTNRNFENVLIYSLLVLLSASLFAVFRYLIFK